MQQFLLKHTETVPLSSCICRPCERSLRRGISGNFKGDFIPRWIKHELKKQKQTCCVPGCVKISERSCVLPFDVICEAANVSVGQEPVANASGPFLLCSQHYYATYSHCRSVSECVLCGSKSRHRAGDAKRLPLRPLPEPESIQNVLDEMGECEKSLHTDSVVCNSCYLFCKKLLHQYGEDMRSTESIMQSLTAKVCDLKERVQNSSEHKEIALLHTALFLGEEMLVDHALTFPILYQKYVSLLRRESYDALPLPGYKVFLYVGKEFGDLLSSSCPCKRIGRLLYRTKCDPYVMLSHALGATKSGNSKSAPTSSPPLKQVASYLNEKIHVLACNTTSKYDEAPVASCVFNLEEFVSSVPPDLWEMLNELTLSKRDRHGRKQSEAHAHERKVRVAYLVCVVMFCASSGYCSVPLHTLLTDYIEATGGSSELISVLNKLGAVASSETLDRHIMRVSVQRKMEGLLKELDSSRFTVATTDNIDFLQSHASVYSGSQHRSWHGTSVQIVQPQQRLKNVLVEPDVSILSVSSPSRSPGMDELVDRRRLRSSPINSPSQQTRSLAYKRMKRARTITEAVSIGEVSRSALMNAEPLKTPSMRESTIISNLQYVDFLSSSEEQAAMNVLNVQIFNYIVHKLALKPDNMLCSFKDHMCAMKSSSIHAEPTTVVYLSVLDIHADTVEAMSEVAAMLYKEYIVTTGAAHLVVAGDAKTYLRLKELKQEYGDELKWLLPFIGDWHVLFNYQKVLMKVYFEVGLKDLARAAGFRAETLTSLGNASNFKRTHAFLMQVWEALYRHMFNLYVSHDRCLPEDLLSGVKARLISCNDRCAENCTLDDYVHVTARTESECSELYSCFVSFLMDLADKDDTCKFWINFLLHDCQAYVGLYIAIRGGMWALRMASLKEMCPVFTAFDRLNYMKILPQHFAEVSSLPDVVKDCFSKGGFVCNIRGTEMHAVALDEAHEMLVNKDIKTYVVRPSKEYLNKIMYYYPVRSMVCKQLKDQLSLPCVREKPPSIFDSTPHTAKCEENIESMTSKLSDLDVLHAEQENRGLIALNGTPATPEQHRDLICFREIGSQYFEAYVKYYILREPSAMVPQRKRRLQKFNVPKKRPTKIKVKEREQKFVSRCLRKQLAWSGQPQCTINGQQYLELPRALCTPSGEPHKGQKSYTTKFYEKRYNDVILNRFPGLWVPDTVVLEGMFLINTAPLVTHVTMRDYAVFLVKRFIIPHLAKGVKEVHIVYDMPACNLTPKAFEQGRRDTEHSVSSDHEHVAFTDVANVPQKWREYLHCRCCKRQLVLYLGQSFVHVVPPVLHGDQRVVTAGCHEGGKAMSISTSGVEEGPTLECDAEESDTRVWLHVLCSSGHKKFLYSPDTDVYHIGLTLIDPCVQDVYVQLSNISSPELKLLHLNQLIHNFRNDPDLSLVPQPLIPRVIQTLFIGSGCDYISFFVGLGKATIMKHFFQNAWFITGSQDIPGTLAHTRPDLMEEGFLSFVRLIGTVYFKKHLAEFTLDTPRALYMSLSQDGVGPAEQHKKFIEVIRESVWSRIEFEDELPPSFDALWRHWQRTCWVSDMWNQAARNHMRLLDITQYGWKIVDGKLECDWESVENREAVRQQLGLLFRGCSCSSVTACSTRRCSCVKKGNKCGPGCRCKNCGNTPSATGTQQRSSNALVEIEVEELLHDDSLRREYGEVYVSDEEGGGYDSSHEDDV